MEQKIQNNSSDEIIDFDDEYSEEENDKVQDLVEEPIMNKNQQIQNEKVQALSIEDEVQNENIIDDDSLIYGTHFSHEGNDIHDRMEELSIKNGYHIAYDGMKIEI